MRIVADQNIPAVAEAFGQHGEIVLVPGRELKPELLRGADVLLVRSITRVDAGLVAGLRVRFVASASAGMDHVDVEWLDAQGIQFAHAPGCNSTAVSEYLVAALLESAHRNQFELRQKTLGVIGVG